MDESNAAVVVDYTNHRGERSLRTIVPIYIEFGECEWHPGRQWLLHAYDLDRKAMRTFALSSIHSWAPEDER